MNPAIIILIQTVAQIGAPIGAALAQRIAEAIQSNDLGKLTPEDWLELLKYVQQSADDRLRELIAKKLPEES